MGWLDRVRAAVAGTGTTGFDGTSGPPRSANAASSFHLFWDTPGGAWTAAEATLEIAARPVTSALHFWALQVSFAGGSGPGGGAHLGLQWFDRHPGGTAANWGGYRAGGGELEGSASVLSSAPGNVNTRDFAWSPGRPYRLRVERRGPASGGRTAWRGTITDVQAGTTTVVRDLWAPGDRLESLMVWSEIFAPCDGPGIEVRWSDLAVRDRAGTTTPVRRVTVNYQGVRDGGCTTTNSEVDGVTGAFVQRTGTVRTTPQHATLSRP